jgi:tetratricopeptide (TPR) repeat protein
VSSSGTRHAWPRRHGEVALGFGLAAALIALAFVTTGGFDSSITVSAGDTWAEIVITVIGAGAGAAALLFAARQPAWGVTAVGLFGLLTAYTALSILWSVQPDNSWQAANLTLAYLFTFAGAAALARLAPERWRALLAAIALVSVAISAYALLGKVFPASLAAGDTQGRLETPLGYWNATGAASVLGLAPLLWTFSRRGGSALVRGLAVPATAILISVAVLSYSRTAALVAILVVGGWLAYVPSRLRACAMLALAGGASTVIIAWALGRPALTAANQDLAARTAAGHTFGVVVVITLVASTAAGVAMALAGDRGLVPARLRRLATRALLVGAALLPVIVVLALAASSRGLTGEISHAWSSLTSVNNGVGNGADRLGQLGSSRPLYWSEGITVGEHALLKGVGALGYATVRTRYTKSPRIAEHAHSYLIQTFADLGLLGLAINLALVLAWGRSAAAALALGSRWSGLDPGLRAERAGLFALLLVAVAFGLLSASDWTWFFAGVTVPALLAAGWLAGRGPLARSVGRAPRRPPLLSRPAAGAAVALVASLALLGAWLIWQPLRSSQASSAALVAAGQGHTGQAFTDAHAAAAADPLALQPRLVLASLYASIGDQRAARAQLTQAVSLQPENRDSWLALGQYDLAHGQPQRALPSLRRAVALDPTVPETVDTLNQALAAISRRQHHRSHAVRRR